jgi:hypothetical protein
MELASRLMALFTSGYIWTSNQTLRALSKIKIHADTRLKLYVHDNSALAAPVKERKQMWFYDVDKQPFLEKGTKRISIRLLRFYNATSYAVSFSRTTIAGLFVRIPDMYLYDTMGPKATTCRIVPLRHRNAG